MSGVKCQTAIMMSSRYMRVQSRQSSNCAADTCHYGTCPRLLWCCCTFEERWAFRRRVCGARAACGALGRVVALIRERALIRAQRICEHAGTTGLTAEHQREHANRSGSTK
jgi:hypothetical protein